MSTTESIVLRRVVLNRATLTGGALALHNYQLGLARADSEIVMRDDIGSFHYFKSDSANELKYSQLGHVHDDRYYTETEIDTKLSSIIHSNLSGLQGGQAGKYYHLTQLEWETKILGLGITGRIPLYSAERQITSSVLSGDANGIYPITNNAKTLGSTSLRFSEVWGTTLYEAGTALSSKYAPNLVYTWTRGSITGAGWAKILSVTLTNIATTNNSWIFDVLKVGASIGTSSVIGKLRIQWRNGTLDSSFIRFDGGDSVSFGYTGTLAINSLFEVYGYCSTYPYLKIEVKAEDGGVIAGGTFSATNPTMTGIPSITLKGTEYNDTRYAKLSGANFTGDVYSATLIQSGGAISSGTTITAGTDFAVNGFADLRGELQLTGLQVSTNNADTTVSSTASGFVNTATYTANRTVTLPVPKKGKILTLSNLGSSTTYNMLIQPYSRTSIHYGMSPTLVGGTANGIKSIILEGVSSTQWMVISMWSL